MSAGFRYLVILTSEIKRHVPRPFNCLIPNFRRGSLPGQSTRNSNTDNQVSMLSLISPEIALKLSPFPIHRLPAPMSCSARTRNFRDIHHNISRLVVVAHLIRGAMRSVATLL
jgi:hypothetical protein